MRQPPKVNREKDNTHRVNGQIRVSPVVVINDQGRNLGPIPLQKAMDIAHECGLDLVEIAPNSRPPVCRIMDFGKFKFQQAVKEKEQRKKQSKISQMKEVHLSPSIQAHDLETKSKAARRFLESGHRVVVKLEFRRRELAHRDLGDRVMADFISSLEDVCDVTSAPKPDGRTLCCTLGPKDPKKAP